MVVVVAWRGDAAGVAGSGGGGDEGGAFEAFVVSFAFLDVGFFNQPGDEGAVGFFGRFAHEAGHGEVALHFDVFLEPEALFGEAEAEFLGLAGFAGERAAKGPAAFHVEAHGGKDVGLEAVGEVVEAAHEGEGAGDTGEVADFVGDGVPLAVGFFSAGCLWGADGVAVCDEGVEVDHLGVGVEGVEDGLAGDACGQRCDGGEMGLFRHGGRGGGEQTREKRKCSAMS